MGSFHTDRRLRTSSQSLRTLHAEAHTRWTKQPDDLEQRLGALVRTTRRSKEASLVAAIAEYLDDLEDLAIAERRLADVRAGRSGTVSLAWTIECSDEAAKEMR